jgi:membrane protein DedA with SNARE-associated domain
LIPDLTQLIGHWGYSAIFLIIILGSIGIPVPEESIMLLAGLLVWEKKLKFLVVLLIGVLSTVSGDNLGYWAGRRYGRATIERYGQKLLINSERLDVMQNFVNRHGQVAVFLARFIPGLRFLAGPLTGIAGMPFRRFFIANIAGAAVYVPLTVAFGYAFGLGFGQYIPWLEDYLTKAEHIVIAAITITAVASFTWRAFKLKRLRRREK